MRTTLVSLIMLSAIGLGALLAALNGEQRAATMPEMFPPSPTNSSGSASAADLTGSGSRESAGATGPARRGYYSAPSGTSLRFAIETIQEVALRSGQEGGADSRVTLQGEQQVRVVARRSGEALLEVSYPAVSVELAAAGTRADASVKKVIEEELAMPARIRLKEDGTISAWRAADGMGHDSEQIAKGILSILRFVVPPDAEDRWQTIEDDAAGEYTVDYSMTRDGTAALVHRRRVELTPSEACPFPASGMRLDDTGAGTFDITLGWPTDIEAQGIMRACTTDGELTIEARSTVRASLVSAAQGPAEGDPHVWDLAWEAFESTSDQGELVASQQRELDRQAVEGLSVGQILFEIEESIRLHGLASKEVRHAREQLKAMLRVRPGTCHEVLVAVDSGGLSGPAISVAFSAIGSVSGAEGPTALAQIVSDPARENGERFSAMLALFQGERAVPEVSAGALSAWTDPSSSLELRSVALLLLGAQARYSPESQAALLAQEGLVAELTMTRTYIAALHNAHLFSEIERYLADPDAEVRLAVEQALADR